MRSGPAATVPCASATGVASIGVAPRSAQLPWCVRGLVYALPAVALDPDMALAFGLPAPTLALLLLAFAVVHGRGRLQQTASPRAQYLVLAWIALSAAAVMASVGPIPFSWAPLYLGALLLAQRFGRVPALFAGFALLCPLAAAERFVTLAAPLAPTIANAVFPALLYHFLASDEEALRHARTETFTLRRRALEVEANEQRQSLAAEIHDGVGAALIGALLQAEVAERAATTDPARARHALARVESLLATAASDLRSFETQTPASWQEAASFLRALIDQLALPGQCGVVAIDVPAATPLPPGAWRVVRRSVAEAVANAIRHAHCASIEIRIGRREAALWVAIADDGIGRRGAPPGFGTRSLVMRARSLGGRLEIRDRAGGGTVVELQLPWPEPAP